MKHLFTFLLFTLLSFQANAQLTLFDEDFETGYTAGNTAIAVEPLMLQGWGTDFTYQTVSDAGNGASSSDFFVRMVRGGTANYAVIQNVAELESGKTYEYKISIKPASGQAGAYKLQVIDTENGNAIVAGGTAGVKPTTASWNDLTISYIAGASQNYAFRITKSWGNAGADFDNISLVCTDCSTASVSKTNDFQFNIYPNPAKERLRLQTELPLKHVDIFSLTGSKVLSQSYTEEVEIGMLSKGVYMLQATSNDGKVTTQKLIKQ